jgi:molybdopterin converting factor subunit 1
LEIRTGRALASLACLTAGARGGYDSGVAAVDVRLFAVLRERLGRDAERVAFDLPFTAAELIDRMRDRHPDHAAVLALCRVAVNRRFAAPDATIADGDEVALIPPISGG